MSTIIKNMETEYKISNLTDHNSFDDFLESHEFSAETNDQKRSAWDKFNKIAKPTRLNQNWRFANITDLKVEDYAIDAATPADIKIDTVKRSNFLKEKTAEFIFANDTLIKTQAIPEELKQQGVIFTTLEEARENHSELLNEYYKKQHTQLGSEKYEALHYAFQSNGTFLYVPKNVNIEKPFSVYHWLTTENAAIFPHTVIIAEENSKVSFVDFYLSYDGNFGGFSDEITHIYAKQGAQISKKTVQNFNQEVMSFQLDNTIAQKDAYVKSIFVNLGAKKARSENRIQIAGAGSKIETNAMTVSTNTQEFDQRTFQEHAAPHAVSDLLYKNALLDESKTIFSGMIQVDPIAQQTDAYQTNRNLLLNPKSEAISMPGLEIEANDVKCSHGATTSQIDNAQLFYLLSRGITRRAAEELLILGFFEEVIGKIENEELCEAIRTLITEKIHNKVL